MERGEHLGWVIAILVGLQVLAFALRILLRAAFRAEGMPRAEAFVDRWWTWTPFAAIPIGIGLLLGRTWAGVSCAIAGVIVVAVVRERSARSPQRLS